MLKATEFLSCQEKRILSEQEQDLKLWGEKSLDEIWSEEERKFNREITCRRDAEVVYNNVLKCINTLRSEPTDYSFFNPVRSRTTEKIVLTDSPKVIMGRCPCPSEDSVLRCCNMVTLDTAMQCSFGCSYCSIQNFYCNGEIRVINNLREKLFSSEFNSQLERNSVHLLCTGQSSDSMVLGDTYGTLTALSDFCTEHKDIIVMLKSKSARTDWIRPEHPVNLIPTWSVNAPTVIQKEEHGTAGLADRINAACKCIENGYYVGFHIHPMIYFRGFEKEYELLVRMLNDNINPDKVLMISIGTLTFTKNTLKSLRLASDTLRSRVSCMPLTPIAGKYSYPLEIKKEMFSLIYSLFSDKWKERVFFYLCMEDKSLWEPCLKRSYSSNTEFEQDMIGSYFKQIK